uniref:Uncharacterized protein n=1 Tax=Arundo donax TaxID=35708 RepID=A0A0A8ZKL8_ARUDO
MTMNVLEIARWNSYLEQRQFNTGKKNKAEGTDRNYYHSIGLWV